MIRLRYSMILFLLVCVSLCAFGIMHKSSFTDIAHEENFMSQLYVAEITEEFAENECELLASELPNCAFILKVEALEGVDYRYDDGRQKVRVSKVFAGSNITEGDIIYLTTPRWGLDLYDDLKSVERGFVNVLKGNYEYLVFCTSLIESADARIPTYQLYAESYISPVFCYTNFDNVIVEPGEYGTYVPYEQVKNNEFFAASEGALEKWMRLKEAFISRYV